MRNYNLSNARNAKNDEFYTQYDVIEKEIASYLDYDTNVFRNKSILLPCDDPEWSNFTKFFAQNFQRFGLRKLISTSYAPANKASGFEYQPTLFELNDPQFDECKTIRNGKFFTLELDSSGDGKIDIDDLEWSYLVGDGDFRGNEIKNLRNDVDIIITNPPFSLFREFLTWILEAGKQFIIIGNMNAVTYKEVFPLIKNNKVWLGPSITSGDREFRVPDNYPITASGWRIDEHGRKFLRIKGVRWFTNIDHGRRHQPLPLMTMADNLKFSKHKEIKGKTTYDQYDNYSAIEVPFTDAIPSDYSGVMGVPISFLDKYSPDQFEIVGATESEGKGFSSGLWDVSSKVAQPVVRNERVYKRIFIKHRLKIK